MDPVVAIGITTYNRLPALKGCYAAVMRRSESPCVLMIADDGSTDETPQWLDALPSYIRVLRGENHKPEWNRNRIIYEFLMNTDCPVLILMDDDHWPSRDGWEKEWCRAATIWGYVAYAFEENDWANLAGDGTARRPFVSKRTAGSVIAVSRSALMAVGFQDILYADGWGFGDSDWSLRFSMQPLLPLLVETKIGVPFTPCLVLGIRHGIERKDFGSHAREDQMDGNRSTCDALRSKPIWRFPWNSEETKREFLSEFAENRDKSAVTVPVLCTLAP